MATSRQVKKHVPNPTGKGGFQERPQDRNPGHWRPEDSISFQYNKLLRMSDEEFKSFKPKTVAQLIALRRIQNAAQRFGLPDTKEITDRTEGKAPQAIDITSGGERLPTVVIESVYAASPKFRTANDSPAETIDVAENRRLPSGKVQDTPVRKTKR